RATAAVIAHSQPPRCRWSVEISWIAPILKFLQVIPPIVVCIAIRVDVRLTEVLTFPPIRQTVTVSISSEARPNKKVRPVAAQQLGFGEVASSTQQGLLDVPGRGQEIGFRQHVIRLVFDRVMENDSKLVGN